MISPRCIDSVDGNGRVERQCQTEKPKEQAKPHTSAPFQKPADRERAKKSPDKHDHRDRVPLCFRQRAKHQILSISEERSLKQVPGGRLLGRALRLAHLRLPLRKRTDQISYWEQSKTKDRTREVEVMANTALSSPMHRMKYVKSFGDMNKNDHYQTSCAE